MNFNFRSLKSEVGAYFKQVFKLKNSWMLLPGLVPILLVYTLHHANVYTWIMQERFLDSLALWLVSTLLLILTIKAFVSKNPLMIYLAVLALIFCVRELDDTVYTFMEIPHEIKTKRTVRFVLFGMVLWGIGWHGKLFATLNRFITLKITLFGVLWSYVLSQLISRRAFRGVLPYESLLNGSLEEMTETFAHLFFIIFALFCCYVIPNRKQAGVLKSDQDIESSTPDIKA